MALTSTTVWEVRTAGSDNSGGGFNSAAAGTDRSQSDAAFKNGTNLTVDATTNTDVAPDGYTPAAADVGNVVQITTTGTGAAFTVGFYEIRSIQSGKWRLDRSPAAVNSAGATWAMGGALANPGKASGAMASGHMMWLKAGTYTISSTTNNVANGRISLPGSTGTTIGLMEGYNSTRGDKGTKPVLNVTTSFSGVDVITVANNDTQVVNIEIATNANAVNSALNMSGQGSQAYRIKATGSNYATGAIKATNNGIVLQCDVNVSGGAAKGCTLQAGAVARSCRFAGTISAELTAGTLIDCLCTGGNVSIVSRGQMSGCTVSGGRIVTDSSSVRGTIIENTIVANSSGGFGVTAGASGSNGLRLINVGFYNNSGGNYDTTAIPASNVENAYALTADPFTNSGSGDYSLNNAAGGGASLRAAASPSQVPGVLTSIYNDVGALQSRGAVVVVEDD